MKPSHLITILFIFSLSLVLQSCDQETNQPLTEVKTETMNKFEKPEYYSLRPEIEKAFGYSHAVKVGNIIKVSGAVSMDDNGNPTAVGD